MTSSMTAFARVESQQGWGSLVWELRSVNHRYLEPHIRLPETLRELEMPLRERLRKHLSRGKVECTLRIKTDLAATGQININPTQLDSLANACRQVADKMDSTSAINPLEALAWPGVLQEAEVDMKEIGKDALSGFQQALSQLQETRMREGAELEQFIHQRLNKIAEEVEQVRPKLPAILQAQRTKIVQRLEEASIEVDQNRLEQELVMLAQKLDVEEELDRLVTHVNEVKRVIESKGAIGRRLDFLMQELNREANTLASKSIDADMTTSAVNLKVYIEQMREQIQNIE